MKEFISTDKIRIMYKHSFDKYCFMIRITDKQINIKSDKV